MNRIHLHLTGTRARVVLLPQLPGYQVLNLAADPLSGVEVYPLPLSVPVLRLFADLYDHQQNTIKGRFEAAPMGAKEETVWQK